MTRTGLVGFGLRADEVRVLHSQRKFSPQGTIRWLQCLLIGMVLAGCAVPPQPAAEQIPLTGAGGQAAAELKEINPSSAVFRVIEYPLVEQSTDNPDHPAFAARAVEAVATRQAGFGLFRTEDVLDEPNRMLQPFGYRITHSTTPPFSSYALYQHETLVADDISRFWPVEARSAGNFLLFFETLSGDQLVASNSGIEMIATASGPSDERLAYAGASDYPLLAGGIEASEPQDGLIYQKNIGGQALVLFNRSQRVHLAYAGQELPFIYDAVVSGRGPEMAMYNPGSSGRVMWFYALRDGLWYYIETGLME